MPGHADQARSGGLLRLRRHRRVRAGGRGGAVMPEGFSDSLPLSRSTLDRDAISRDRPGMLEESWADPATRVAVLAGGRALLVPDGSGLALVPPASLPEPELLLYLGRTTEE